MNPRRDRSGGYYDFWQQWEQRGIMEQAQSQIARHDASFQAWAEEMRADIARLSRAGMSYLVPQRQDVLDQATAQHMRDMAEMQTQAEQQIAEIDQRYATEAIERERSEAESRERWANTPNNTPRESMPDWRNGYTPTPSYTPRSSDGPAPESGAPDLSAWVDGSDTQPEQGTSILDTLRAWFG